MLTARVSQRGRGRSGGRAVRGRGRMRKRGPSGGGTARRKSPQQGQRPLAATGPAESARSQWPRASHNGLMHCTVKPGRYCMRFPPVAADSAGETLKRSGIPRAARTRIDGRDSAVARLWCQAKRLQSLVVGFRRTVERRCSTQVIVGNERRPAAPSQTSATGQKSCSGTAGKLPEARLAQKAMQRRLDP